MNDLIKNLAEGRYKSLTMLSEPIKFNEAFKDIDIDVVQLHSIELIRVNEKQCDIVGFCGAFSWKNNLIQPLDGDTYWADMYIYGYEWFDTDDGGKGLDILVGNDW